MSSGSESGERQRWAELKALFNDAVERSREDWPSLVRGVRARDADLADQLQRLLDGHTETLIKIKALDPELEPGTALGPYIVAGLIGEGGMGQVYRARDGRLGRDVAIKVLPPELAHDSGRRLRMEREARAMGMLSHPNIVTVYDIGDHDGSPFIVTELLEGRTLREEVAGHAGSKSRLSAGEAVGIVASVADALGAAHRRGIVHRDIKPENIFLTSDGRIKVLDFGIAKLLDGEPAANGTVAGAMIGTLDYMAPEQVRGENPCAQTDVYACGVVLYELLSGARPFAGSSQAVLIGAILHEPPPQLPATPPALAALVARCLNKRADARFGDGVELAAQLRALTGLEAAAFAVEREATATPAGESDRGDVLPTGKITSSKYLLIGAGVVLLAAGFVGSLSWQGRDTPAEPTAIAVPNATPPVTIALPPETIPKGAPSDATTATRASRPAARGAAQPRSNGKSLEPPTTAEPSPPPPQPAPVDSPVAPSLDGVWTVSEKISEDVQSIDCAATGALQLRFNDGLLDGTFKVKRDCTDATRLSTDSTETMAVLSGGTVSGEAVAFVTRVVDEGLVTTCRYAGQIVGSLRGAMAGDVTCEARSVGLSAVLALRGSWRATRISP